MGLVKVNFPRIAQPINRTTRTGTRPWCLVPDMSRIPLHYRQLYHIDKSQSSYIHISWVKGGEKVKSNYHMGTKTDQPGIIEKAAFRIFEM